MTIIDALDDEQLFRRHFSGDSWHRWRVFLKVLFGLPLGGAAEQDIARHHTGREDLPAGPFGECWVAAGRRGGKSRVASLVAVFLGCFRSYEQSLALGETATIMVLASDQEQATVVFDFCRALIVGTPILRPLLVSETRQTLRLSNRTRIVIRSANFRRVRGYACAAVIADEVAFWPPSETGSALGDEETVNALRPALATLPGSLLLGISSVHAKRGILFEQFKRYHGVPGAPVLTWRGTSQELNPGISADFIQRALEADAAKARAEYFSEWRSDTARFIAADQVMAAVIPNRSVLPPVAGVVYHGHLDAAMGSEASTADSMAMAIAHTDEHGRAVLDCTMEVRPRFSTKQVARDFSALFREYRVCRVQADRAGLKWVLEEFALHGVQIEWCAQTTSELYLQLGVAICSGQVELLDDDRLIAQLVNLERTVGRTRDFVSHPRGGHDDVICAAAGALVAAKATPTVPAGAFAINESFSRPSYWAPAWG